MCGAPHGEQHFHASSETKMFRGHCCLFASRDGIGVGLLGKVETGLVPPLALASLLQLKVMLVPVMSGKMGSRLVLLLDGKLVMQLVLVLDGKSALVLDLKPALE